MLLSELFPSSRMEITGLLWIPHGKTRVYVFCIKGYEQDGHKYADSAADNGAADRHDRRGQRSQV